MLINRSLALSLPDRSCGSSGTLPRSPLEFMLPSTHNYKYRHIQATSCRYTTLPIWIHWETRKPVRLVSCVDLNKMTTSDLKTRQRLSSTKVHSIALRSVKRVSLFQLGTPTWIPHQWDRFILKMFFLCMRLSPLEILGEAVAFRVHRLTDSQ